MSDHPVLSPVSSDTWPRVALSSLPASRKKKAMNDFSFLMSCTKVSEAPYFFADSPVHCPSFLWLPLWDLQLEFGC